MASIKEVTPVGPLGAALVIMVLCVYKTKAKTSKDISLYKLVVIYLKGRSRRMASASSLEFQYAL